MFTRLLIIILLSFASIYSQAGQSFSLFGSTWSPAFIQRTATGWQHVYLCQSCRFNPSLTINTSENPEPDNAFMHELERSFHHVTVEQENSDQIRNFSIIKAIRAIDPYGPDKLTVLSTRLPSGDGKYWHHIQTVIEQGPMAEEALIENHWIHYLTNTEVVGRRLILPTKESVHIDLSSPDSNWLSDITERSGVTHQMFEHPVTTAGLFIIGAQLTLGLSGVRGPCGKPLHQCPCTKRALNAINAPSLP